MAGFHLFFSRSMTESIDSLDRELKSYFRESTSFRSRARNGTVVIIDQVTDLFAFLSGLVNRCRLKFQVVHVDNVLNARKLLEEIGQVNVKSVVINNNLLFEPIEDGITLAQWISQTYPEIPVWISECPPERDKDVHKVSQRVGILRKNESPQEYINVLGFPSRCLEHVEPKNHDAYPVCNAAAIK